MYKEIIPNILEILTLISSLFLVFLILLFILKFGFKKKTKLYDTIVHGLQDNYLVLGFLISLVATLGSLFYSNVLGYPPCKLCWYQRIFMYPQVFLYLIAMNSKKNERSIIWNSLFLSFIGLFIAGYHYMLQLGTLDNNGIACDFVGMTSNCSQHFEFYYGYITIPFMAITAFALLIVLSYGKFRRIYTLKIS